MDYWALIAGLVLGWLLCTWTRNLADAKRRAAAKVDFAQQWIELGTQPVELQVARLDRTLTDDDLEAIREISREAVYEARRA